jgi:hypothetical protein
VSELRELKLLAVMLQEAELSTREKSIANRIAAGEAPDRVAGPRSTLAASERAVADIHKLEQRKCRRATSSFEIVASMRQLMDDDINFWLPNIERIELPANRALSEQLLAQKITIRQKLNAFLSNGKGAA